MPVHSNPGLPRVAGALASRLAAIRARADEGQALVLALIVVLLIGLLPAIVLSSLNQEMPYASESVNYASALAAAEAGVQEYANLLDQYPGYQDYPPQPGGANSTNDPGLPGGTNLALGAWASVSGANPPEWFSYYPDTSELATVASATNPFGGDILLVVTGKAGTGKTTQYRRIEAAFNISGILTDVYFSNFEQPAAGDLDQWENTFRNGCGPGQCSPITGSHEYDEVLAHTPPGYTAPNGNTAIPMATALCQYTASTPNAYIDWYSQNVSKIYPLPGYPGNSTLTAYSESNPYYGPWYGTFPDPLDPSYQFGEAPANGSQGGMQAYQGDESACNTNYWITGDTFTGPVYSQDELTTCGSPSFTGDPSLQTAVQAHFQFPATSTVGWPGAGPPQPSPTGSGYVSYPYGYNWNPWGDGGICGGNSGTPRPGVNAPTFSSPSSPAFSVNQSLPQANQALVGEIQDGKIAGCIYTGPTMIRFSYNVSTHAETMYVWSPLTKDTYGANSPTPENSINCGATPTTTTSHSSGFGDLCGGTACTYSGGVPTNTQVLGSRGGTVQTKYFAQVPITTQTVIAVQNLPASTTDPNSWATIPAAETNAPVANCIDPWTNPDSPSTTYSTPGTCTNGDAILSGAVSYQVTVSSANDIVIARSLAYGCAVKADLSYHHTLANCTGSPDVLGLIALNNIWMARPWSSRSGMAPDCTDNIDLSAPMAVSYGSGTSWWNNMIPNCTVVNPVIDAATAALNGFFEVEYWREGNAAGGTISFNGSDAVNNAGQFGVFGSGGLQSGYLLNLTYDSRLKADPPPQYLPATDGVWAEVGWVTCGSTVPNPDTSGYPPSTVPACTSLAGSVPP